MAIERTKDGGMILTGQHIEWYRLVMLLSALRMELIGMKMFRGGGKASVTLKREIGLPSKHPNRFVFMYANNAMRAQNLISEKLYQSNVKFLNEKCKD